MSAQDGLLKDTYDDGVSEALKRKRRKLAETKGVPDDDEEMKDG